MAGPLFFDAVQDTSTTTGTADYVISGTPPASFFPWSLVGNGNTAYYMATDGTNREVGLATYSSTGPTLARTTILASTNGGAKVSWGAGTRTISLVDPALFFSGLLTSSTAFGPNANDGKALGTSTLSWSDLFLAAGGVINWNAGDVTITESTNALAFAGASSGYSFDAQVTGVTASNGDSSTKLATTAFVASNGGQPIPTNSTFAVGSLVLCLYVSTTNVGLAATTSGTNLGALAGTVSGGIAAGPAQTGTWRNDRGAVTGTTGTSYGYWTRTA